MNKKTAYVVEILNGHAYLGKNGRAVVCGERAEFGTIREATEALTRAVYNGEFVRIKMTNVEEK